MKNKNGRKKDEITCVALTKDTRNKLAEIGTKSQTFEQIILNLMDTDCAQTIGESRDDK